VGSTGVVTVDGTGSNLSVQSDGGLILVGNVGNGTLNVTNGGNVHPDSSDFSILLDVGTLGTLNITGGGQAVDNDGSVLGTVTVDGAGSTWTNVASLSVSGTLTVTNGGMVQAPTLTVGAIGEMRGDGNIIGNVQNAGVVSPGTSPGALNIDGNYTQTASGELLIELTSASSYDQLLTTETATLSGTLTVNLLDSFLPSPGQSFTILTADDIDGMFTTETLPSVPGRIFDVIYNPNSVVLTVLSALPGDYNGNGTVDAADYTVWRDNLGGSSLPNEGASLGTVDDFDYDFWKLHFGETAGSGSAGVSPSQAAVPEPATLSLMLGGLIAALLMRGVRRTGSRR
jgi:T5SS/PEP-CTERM-associated repeat protein